MTATVTLVRAATRSRKYLHSSHIRLYSDAAQTKQKRRIVFSGIQPTGTPHLGNFLGALSNWVQLQKSAAPEDQLIFSVVGWHALTLPQNPAELREARQNMMAVLLAIGLDPKRSIIFHQDHNPDHTELAWLLNCITPVGRLRRMTTWKSRLATSRNANDESEIDESLLNAGLLTYPVLQAADILAYRATEVPVGEDQAQHLELARDIADSFNRTFKPGLFPLPASVHTPSKRILSLRDPSSKMSKSSPDVNSRIMLTDSASSILKKLKSAVTDSTPGISYDPIHRPGTSNLLTMFSACTGESVESLVSRYENKGHGELKQDVAEAVDVVIQAPRGEYERLKNDWGYLEDMAKEGARRAREVTTKTLHEVRTRVGLA